MTHAHTQRLRRFSLEAVPNNLGQFQAVFRIHLDGALPADDEIHFGEVWNDPMSAFEEARTIANKHMSRAAVEG